MEAFMTSGMGRVWVESVGYFFLLTKVFFFFKHIKNVLKFKKIIKKFNKIVSSKDDFQKYPTFLYNFQSGLFMAHMLKH